MALQQNPLKSLAILIINYVLPEMFYKSLNPGNKTAPIFSGHKGKTTVLNGYKRKSANSNSRHWELSFFAISGSNIYKGKSS